MGQYLVEHSYLLNFFYWQRPRTDVSGYLTALKQAYADPEVLAAHFQDLAKFTDYAKGRGIPLIVVLFPILQDLDSSYSMLEPIRNFMGQHDVDVVDVTPMAAKMPFSERVVNANDGHASMALQKMVADTLYQLSSAKIVSSRPGTSYRARIEHDDS
jgi:hypothetical protein